MVRQMKKISEEIHEFTKFGNMPLKLNLYIKIPFFSLILSVVIGVLIGLSVNDFLGGMRLSINIFIIIIILSYGFVLFFVESNLTEIKGIRKIKVLNEKKNKNKIVGNYKIDESEVKQINQSIMLNEKYTKYILTIPFVFGIVVGLLKSQYEGSFELVLFFIWGVVGLFIGIIFEIIIIKLIDEVQIIKTELRYKNLNNN